MVGVALLWGGCLKKVESPDNGAPECAVTTPHTLEKKRTGESKPAHQPVAVPMKIMARNGAVDIVLIDKNTQQHVLKKSLVVGESISIDKHGPLIMIYSNGDNVSVSLKGQTFRSGPGRTVIP